MIVGYEGEPRRGRRRRAAVAAVLRLGADLGRSRAGLGAGRYHAPYLRDALLDAGVLAETLETAAFWSRPAGAVRRGPRRADRRPRRGAARAVPHLPRLRDGRVAVLHSGGRQGDDPVAQWRAAKAAASEAILAAGGTIPTTTRSAPTTAEACAGDRPARRAGAAGGQGRAGPGRRLRPGVLDPSPPAATRSRVPGKPASGVGPARGAEVAARAGSGRRRRRPSRLLARAAGEHDRGRGRRRGDAVVAVGGDGMLCSGGEVARHGGTLGWYRPGAATTSPGRSGCPTTPRLAEVLLAGTDRRWTPSWAVDGRP